MAVLALARQRADVAAPAWRAGSGEGGRQPGSGERGSAARGSTNGPSSRVASVEGAPREAARGPAVGAGPLACDDVRVLLAMATTDALEGGRAAVLRPDRRKRLNRLARGLGLRPFDAALIMAVAQDAARRGKGVRSAETLARLSVVACGPTGHAGRCRWCGLCRTSPGALALGAELGLALAGGVIGWLMLG
jgi:hypothetical protein